MNMVDTGLINVFDMDVLYFGWVSRRPRLIWMTLRPHQIHCRHREHHRCHPSRDRLGHHPVLQDQIGTTDPDFLFTLGKKLATLGCTTILISEITSQRKTLTGLRSVWKRPLPTVSSSWAIPNGWATCSVFQVVKMRGTSHSRAKHAIELTPLGVMPVPMLKWGASSDNSSRWGLRDV